jgi:hypothetical protein
VTDGTSPTAIRTIVPHVADVVDAVEARDRERATTVLRLTPPFSARMRARLHVPTGGYEPNTPGAPLHIPPRRLVAAPPFPTPDRTADELRERGTYDRERHNTYHQRRVTEWREAVADGIRDRVSIDTHAGEHTVDVAPLGTWPREEDGDR